MNNNMNRKLRNINGGFTLVELLISVAVLSIVVIAITTAMSLSSKSFSNGSSNVGLQSDAQTATNLLSNMVMDAKSVSQVGMGTGTEDGTLSIISVDGAQIEISYDNANGLLSYSKTVGGTTESGTLAEGMNFFKVDSSSFATNKNVYFDMGLKDYTGRMDFNTTFTATSRNEDKDTESADSAVIVMDTAILIEPGQTIVLPYDVVTGGAVTDKTLDLSTFSFYGNNDSYMTDAVIVGNNVSITCGTAEDAEQFYVKLETNAKNSEGKALDSKTILCKVRRVTGITMKGPASGNGKIGDIYNVTAQMKVNNGPQEITFDTDKTDYVSPYPVTFTYEVRNDTGAIVPTGNYISITESLSSESNVTKLSVIHAIPKNYSIKVIAVSKHSVGDNKTGTDYGAVSGSFTIDITNSTPGGDFFPPFGLNRGEEKVITASSKADEIKQQVLDERGISGRYHYFYRIGAIEPSTGYVTWSEYRPTEEDGTNMKISRQMSLVFLPHVDYKIEFLGVLVDISNSKSILWPHYAEIISGDGTGKNGFAGYTYAFDNSDPYVGIDACGVRNDLAAVSVAYEENTALGLSEGSNGNSSTIPSLKLSDVTSSSVGISFKVSEDVLGLEYTGFFEGENYVAAVEKFDGTSWVKTTELNAKVTGANVEFWNIKDKDSTLGQYRVLLSLKNSSDTFAIQAFPSAEKEKLYQKDMTLTADDLTLYDLSTDAGVIYFNIVE